MDRTIKRSNELVAWWHVEVQDVRSFKSYFCALWFVLTLIFSDCSAMLNVASPPTVPSACNTEPFRQLTPLDLSTSSYGHSLGFPTIFEELGTEYSNNVNTAPFRSLQLDPSIPVMSPSNQLHPQQHNHNGSLSPSNQLQPRHHDHNGYLSPSNQLQPRHHNHNGSLSPLDHISFGNQTWNDSHYGSFSPLDNHPLGNPTWNDSHSNNNGSLGKPDFEHCLQSMTSTFLTCLSAASQKTYEQFSEVKQSIDSINSELSTLRNAMNTTGTALINQHAEQSFINVDALEQLIIHALIKHLPAIGNGIEIGWPTVHNNDNVSVAISIRLVQYVLLSTYHKKVSIDTLDQILSKYDTAHLGTRQVINNRVKTWFSYFGLIPLTSTYTIGKKQFKKINLKALLTRIPRPYHADFSTVVLDSGIRRKPFSRPKGTQNVQGSDRKLHAYGTPESLAYTQMSRMLCEWYLGDKEITPATRSKLEQAWKELQTNQGFLDMDFEVIRFQSHS